MKKGHRTLTVYIPVELHKDIRLHTAMWDITFSALAERGLRLAMKEENENLPVGLRELEVGMSEWKS
jgi:hypothetical protein